jgi:hypothetical protein
MRVVRVSCHIFWLDKCSCILYVSDEYGFHARIR